MRYDYTKFKEIKKSLISLHLTGNVTNQEYEHCATCEFHNGRKNKKVLYDIVNNEQYEMKPFHFLDCRTALIAGI